MLWIGRLRTTLLLAGLSASCIEAPTGKTGRSGPQPSQADREAGDRAATAAPELVPAGPGEVVDVVKRAVDLARADGRTVVVYVGATWCEPCEAFHRAVERGELDGPLAGVRLLEFDADVDGPRLDAAGYSGRFIPRFVVPTDDGHPSSHSVEGGINGDGAVDHIMKRLGPVLARAAEGR